MDAHYTKKGASDLEHLLLLQYEKVDKSLARLMLTPSYYESEGLLSLLIQASALRQFIGSGCHQSMDRLSASVRLMMKSSISQQKVFALARQYCRESSSELLRARHKLQVIIQHQYLCLERGADLGARTLGESLKKLWRVLSFYLNGVSQQQCKAQMQTEELITVVCDFEKVFVGDMCELSLNACLEKRVVRWVTKKGLLLNMERKEVRILAALGFFMSSGVTILSLINDILRMDSNSQYYTSKTEIAVKERRSSKALGLLLLSTGAHKKDVFFRHVEQRADVGFRGAEILKPVSEAGKRELFLDLGTLLAWRLSSSSAEDGAEVNELKGKTVDSAEIADDIVYAAYRLQQSLRNRVVADEGLRLLTEILFFYRQKGLKLYGNLYTRIMHFTALINAQLVGKGWSDDNNVSQVLCAHLDLLFLRAENNRLSLGLVSLPRDESTSVQLIEQGTNQSVKVAKFLSTQLHSLINLSTTVNDSRINVCRMQSTLVKELRTLHHGAAILSVPEIEQMCSLLLSTHEAWLFFPSLISRERIADELVAAHVELVSMLNQAAAWRDVKRPVNLILALEEGQARVDEVLSSQPLEKSYSFAQQMHAFIRRLCWLLKSRVHLECRSPFRSHFSETSGVLFASATAMIRFIFLEQIESVEERQKYGKPVQARLVLAGTIKNRKLKLSLSDDGRGRRLGQEVLRRLSSQVGCKVRHVRFSPQGNTYQWCVDGIHHCKE